MIATVIPGRSGSSFVAALMCCAAILWASPSLAATADPGGLKVAPPDAGTPAELMAGPAYLFNSGTPVTNPYGTCGGCYAWSSTYYSTSANYDLTGRSFTVPPGSTATALRLWWAYGDDGPRPNNANKGGHASDFSRISLDLYAFTSGGPGAFIANLAGSWAVLDAATNYREYRLAAPYTFASDKYFVTLRAETSKSNYDATVLWLMCAPGDPQLDYEDYATAAGNTGGWKAYTDPLIGPCPADQNFGLQVVSDNLVSPVPPSLCITPAHPCVTVPVNITRTTADNLRGYSVDVQLSANLSLCGSISEGNYLSLIGGTNFHAVANGGGSYTVDCAILGLPCGATGPGGNLFNIPVTGTADGTGVVTVTAVSLRDCANAPVAVAAGLPASVSIDVTPPAAVANLAASQVKIGNDSDGTTKVTLTFTAPVDAAVVEVYRAPFGNYPEYDDAPAAGAIPPVPGYPPGPPWTVTSVTASGQRDETAARDYWYFVLFTKDACGNVSAVSNRTNGTLNYHLGDVHNGTSLAGDNLVNTADVSYFGAHYGLLLGVSDPLGCLDVGPTENHTVNARPLTDNRVNFEDLMMFAINYGTVSKGLVRPAPAASDAVRVDAPGVVQAGDDVTAAVMMTGTGLVQGLSLQLGWNGSVVQPVAVRPAGLLERNGGVAFSSSPGNVDAAVLGTDGAGITGEGALAHVIFRAIASGDPQITLLAVDARNAENSGVSLQTAGGNVNRSAIPKMTELLPAAPNPFNPMTTIPYRLASAGTVEVAVFAADGRLVRLLVSARREAGEYRVVWDGSDDEGRAVASGRYFARLRAGDTVHTRSVTLLK